MEKHRAVYIYFASSLCWDYYYDEPAKIPFQPVRAETGF